MLDLLRMGRRDLFPPGGRELYHQIATLTRLQADSEVLVVGSGPGLSAEYLAREWSARSSGVDPDSSLVERAEARVRDAGLAHRATFQVGSPLDLPYRNGIFDVVVGEVDPGGADHDERAIRELVRVLRPGGYVALVKLVWKAPVEATRREELTRHLGARPLMRTEWKRLLRAAGVRHIHAEDWSDDQTSLRPGGIHPFPDFAEVFSLVEKAGILRRAWSRWGWSGVRTALAREAEVHRVLTRERILGLDLLVGRVVGEAAPEPSPPPGASPSGSEQPSTGTPT